MVDYFETTLVPVGIKKLMKTIRTVGICTEIFVIVLVIVLGVTRRFSDLAAGILFSVLIHLLIAPVLIPGLLFDKVSQSTVCLTESRMQILDKSGNCWRTIDYRDITDVRDVNLSVSLEKVEDGIKVVFGEKSDFGFPALLSIHLNEKWTALGATGYKDDAAVFSVSITGSKTSILNISVNRAVGECVIRPNEENETTTDHNRPNSDGSAIDQDKYLTDPVPEGKPLPVEPENQEINKDKAYTCTFSIECSTILNNLENLDPDKLELVPSNGVILPPTTVTFYEGESVFDVLQRVCKEYNIHLEFSFTPVYNSAYIEGIHNLYEFDCGALSGWMYRVNGWYPNYGCSRYQLADGEVVEWRYTCNYLGKDIGCDWMG